MKFNLEIRKVVNIFLVNLKNKMIKINGIKTMVKVRKFLEEKRIKKEKLDNLNADMFYKKKLKQKLFAFLLKYKNISIKEDESMLKKYEIYQKRNILDKLKKSIKLEFLECKEKKDAIINRHLYFIKKKMFYVLIHFAKEKRDEKIKEDIMFKLRNKAGNIQTYDNLVEYLNKTMEEAIKDYYTSDEFKNFIANEEIIEYDKAFYKEKKFSILQDYGFLRLIKGQY